MKFPVAIALLTLSIFVNNSFALDCKMPKTRDAITCLEGEIAKINEEFAELRKLKQLPGREGKPGKDGATGARGPQGRQGPRGENGTKIARGVTNPVTDKWSPINGGCTLKVNTSSAGFPSGSEPSYFISLYGTTNMWEYTGSSSIYSPTHNSFVVNLRGVNCSNANLWSYRVHWVAINK